MCREATGRLSFAKRLIEVDADKPLPDSFTVIIPNEDGVDPIEVTVRLEYPWRPSWCSQCSIFGHNVQNCPVCVARQEKKIREELEAKKGEQEKEEFIVVHRKGKRKVPSQQGYFQQGGYYQGNNFQGGNGQGARKLGGGGVGNKKQTSNFQYVETFNCIQFTTQYSGNLKWLKRSISRIIHNQQ
ncbi:hypothetical protein POM88_001308 [Heracleum sosnowskyi]|uniref:Zinc knuckle CX2CX4HX4C domain-containing protein n=1 Tax=Heracleum sosnowskyi TaxID=360622 RepID=A0AAD8NBL4_9APIA|nr:hypothetical protein POM88_001308 [Heracleum sosnowskyi]